jgi:hypothetical protein
MWLFTQFTKYTSQLAQVGNRQPCLVSKARAYC